MELLKLFECPEHDEDFENNKDCHTCSRILKQISANKEAYKRSQETKRVKLREQVYWPSEMGHMGRTIENLEHRPVHFATKTSYREYLKRHDVREAG